MTDEINKALAVVDDRLAFHETKRDLTQARDVAQLHQVCINELETVRLELLHIGNGQEELSVPQRVGGGAWACPGCGNQVDAFGHHGRYHCGSCGKVLLVTSGGVRSMPLTDDGAAGLEFKAG